MTTSSSPPAAIEADGSHRVPARTLQARLGGLFVADGDDFVTRPLDGFELDLEGILVPGLAGDRHRGHARPADSRVPWYPRGVLIRNARQVSLVSPQELDAVAAALGIPRVTPEEIGANMLLEGVERLTRLPRGTRLHFPGGASLAVEDENAPCRQAGGSVARRNPGRPGLDLDFVPAARGRRGLVAWVERPGRVSVGDAIEVKIPEQWIY